MNKYSILGILAVLGILTNMFGAWAKITHQPYGDTAITIGIFMQAIGLAALAWILIIWLKKKK